MHLKADEEPYYNVYKYAFFGKVPEIELDPIEKVIKGLEGRPKLSKKK